MPQFKVMLTRDCSFTQSAIVQIQATDAAHAQMLAESLYQDDLCTDGPITDEGKPAIGNATVVTPWRDDDGSYHFGEDTGIYVADDATTEEMPA